MIDIVFIQRGRNKDFIIGPQQTIQIFMKRDASLFESNVEVELQRICYNHNHYYFLLLVITTADKHVTLKRKLAFSTSWFNLIYPENSKKSKMWTTKDEVALMSKPIVCLYIIRVRVRGWKVSFGACLLALPMLQNS